MIAAIVLAAGASRRMGSPKLLLDLGGRSVVRRVVDTVLGSSVDEVVVVVGPNREAMEETLVGAPVALIENPAYLEGMSTSLRAGVAALRPEVEAAIVVLGDQPFIGAEVIEALVATYHETNMPIVVPLYAGQRGTPVLFQRRLFEELLSQRGDQGGRDVLAAHPELIATVEVSPDMDRRDVDTPDDYRAAVVQVERDG